ncbi:MAG: ABC transporter permease [Traorella sp.]
MKMWKRILTSITRRKAQTIITFLVVFILGNVLFASIAVKQSAKNVETQLRARVPSTISIKNNEDTYIKPGYIRDLIKLTKNIEKEENVEKVIRITSMNNFYSSLFVNDYQALIDGLDIVEGRNYTKEDFEGDTFKVVMVESYAFDYQIGDTIPCDLSVYRIDQENEELIEEYIPMELEIIGFTSGYHYDTDNIIIERDALFIMPESYQDKIMEIQDEYYRETGLISQDEIFYDYFFGCNPIIEGIVISVNGMDNIDAVANEIKNDELYQRSLFVLQTSAEDFRYVQAPLENLKALANVTLWACIVLVITILGLVSILFIRNRKQEIGVLMSLGERKSKLIGQFALEIILVGLLASSMSLISGNRLGSTISNEFMKIQIDTEAEIEYQNKHQGAMTQLDMLEAYEIKIDAEYIITIYLVSVIILFISATAPMIFILKTDPKKVMLP